MKSLRIIMLAGLTGVALMLPALPTSADTRDDSRYKHSRRDGDYRRSGGRYATNKDHKFNRPGAERREHVRRARFDDSQSRRDRHHGKYQGSRGHHNKPAVREKFSNVRDARKDVQEGRRELRGDFKDLRKDKAELRRDIRNGASTEELRRDRREIRDDYKEIANDRRDLRQDQGELRDARGELKDALHKR
jgi:hypothetical protein